MSKRVTLILFLVVLVYIVIGGVVVHFLEAVNEDETLARSNDVLRQFLG